LNISIDLDKIVKWYWQGKIEYDAYNSEEIVFSSKQKQPLHPKIELGSEAIVGTFIPSLERL